jgi:hypothetical protein
MDMECIRMSYDVEIKVPGREMNISGRTVVFASLSLAASKQYRNEIKSMYKGGLPDQDLVAKLALASLKRNYPGMTLAEVEELLDDDNYLEVWQAVMNFTGLVKKAGEMMRRVQAAMEEAGLTNLSPTS